VVLQAVKKLSGFVSGHGFSRAERRYRICLGFSPCGMLSKLDLQTPPFFRSPFSPGGTFSLIPAEIMRFSADCFAPARFLSAPGLKPGTFPFPV
jgi:hypothetical protein